MIANSPVISGCDCRIASAALNDSSRAPFPGSFATISTPLPASAEVDATPRKADASGIAPLRPDNVPMP